jgi:hypothetical protein
MRRVIYIFVLLFVSCGYKPIAYYATQNIKSVYIHIKIDPNYPDNFIVSKNKIISLLKDKFHIKVVNNKSLSNTQINMQISKINFEPIEYKNAFISKYRTLVEVKFIYFIKNKKYIKVLKSKYDFVSQEDTLYSRLLVDEKVLSVNQATLIAIDNFISSIIYKK